MKKMIVLAVLLCCTIAQAQNGFLLQPEGGIGFGNAKGRVSDGFSWYEPHQSIQVYNVELGLNYKMNKWLFGTGIILMTSGHNDWVYDNGIVDHNYNFFFTTIPPEEITGIKCTYYHINLPATIGYQLDLSRHLFIMPVIGCLVSYNAAVREIISYNDNNKDYRSLKGVGFTNIYHQYSLWGIGKLMAGYNINKRMSIIAGPEVQYMLTSIAKNNTQRNYTCSLNAGIRWQIKKPMVRNIEPPAGLGSLSQ